MPHSFLPSSRRLSAYLCVAACTMLVGSTEAFASATTGHAPSVWDLKYLWLNFILYVALLYILLRKVIASSWTARRSRIERSVSAATSEVDSAERELRAIEELVRKLKSEQDRARNEVLSIAREEALATIRAAQERATRIRTQTSELLKGEARSAETTFRTALVARAVELAKSKFSSGAFTNRQDTYVAAAVDRAKRLIQ